MSTGAKDRVLRYRCQCCETYHVHGAEGGAGQRVAHCDGPSHSWIEAYDVGEAAAELPATAIHARRDLRLWREMHFVQSSLRCRIRNCLVRPGGLQRAWATSASFDAGKVEALSDGRWSIVAKTGEEAAGSDFISLAACGFGVSKGVAAIRLIEACACVVFDAIAVREIMEAIERWYARGAPRGAGRRS